MIVVRADRMRVHGHDFQAWVERPPDDLWQAIVGQESVSVVGESAGGLYVGSGIPDQVSGYGIRIVGKAHRARWYERPVVRMASRVLEKEGAPVLD